MSTKSDGQGQGDGQGGTALATRVDGIEAEQKRQGSAIDQILQIVQGGGQAQGGGQGGGADPGVTYSDISAQIQAGIDQAEQRRRAEEGEREQASWRERVTADLETLKAENVPREPVTGVRGRLQRALLGRDE